MEKTIHSFVGTEPCSMDTKEGKQESLHKRQNKLLRGGLKRKREEAETYFATKEEEEYVKL